MDILSYAIASKQSRRIKRFLANPDSNSGIITTPSKIAAGEVITIPVGRMAILPDIVIEGELNIEGDVFIPSGGSYNQVDMICDNIKSRDNTVTIVTKEIVDTTKDQDITGVKNFTNGLMTQGENISPYGGFKNLLVNGDMSVWNNGVGPFNLNGSITADRWRYFCATGGNVVKGASSATVGFRFPLVMTKTVSTAYQFISQVIPSFAGLSGKTVTISCKVYCTGGLTKVGFGITGNPKVNSNTVQTSASYSNKETITVGSEIFKTISRTITLPTYVDNTYTFAVAIAIGDDYTTELGSVFIKDVQMELGDKATAFEQRPADLEYMLCGEPNIGSYKNYTPYLMSNTRGLKNLFINPLFTVWQRGTSLTGIVGNVFLADRWRTYSSVTHNISRQTLPDGRPYISMTTTANNGKLALFQCIENQKYMFGKTYTMSALISATVGEKVILYVEVAGTGSVYQSEVTIATGGEQRLSFTFSIPSNATFADSTTFYGISVLESVPIKVLNVFAMQLEEGFAATGFENRTPALELMLCQRYYELYTGVIALRMANYTTGGIIFNSIPFKVSKRTTPTMYITNASVYTVNSNTVTGFTFGAQASINDFFIIATKAAHGLTDAVLASSVNWSADAEL